METIKRLEREKKVVQKKNREEEENEKQKRPSEKEKRGSKNDWTKGYESGLFDEEQDFTE